MNDAAIPEHAPRRVLVVDDEDLIVRSLSTFLRTEGYETTPANSGEEAIRKMTEEPARVVLLDIKMPGMDGLQTLDCIRERWPGTETIIISGHGEMEHVVQALRRGAYNYLEKPVDFDELGISVERAFEKQYAAERFHEVQEQLYHAQKMESLGTLAGGVAHEFNNLMGGIVGYCNMALDHDDPDLSKKALEISVKAANRAGEIARNLLRFARKSEGRRERADMNDIVRDTLVLMRVDMESEQIVLELDFGSPPDVHVDVSQFQQIVLNLIVNARQSLHGMKEGRRRIVIRTWREGDEACLSVADNGSGIPEEHLQRVFEPFFTTRGVLGGGAVDGATGLGLSVVEGIVAGHGGSVTAGNAPDGGAVLTVRLPAAEAAGTRAGRVLLVDDEVAIHRIVQAILRSGGFEVETAMTGEECLGLVRRREYDLVVLDQKMPGMSGLETLRELQMIAAKTPVVMLTAFYSPSVAREAVLGGARECVSKPINNEKLLFLARKYAGRDDTTADYSVEQTGIEPEKRLILIVDDDETIRDVYSLILRRAGYRTAAARDGGEAVGMTETSYYDLIIMDLLMPGVDGVNAIRAIRVNNPYTPIVISTGQATDGMIRQGLGAGATRVLLKPVNPSGLIEEVTRLLSIYAEAGRSSDDSGAEPTEG